MYVVCYWCPHCRIYHLAGLIEWIGNDPYHRSSDGVMHAVEKSKYWMN